MPTLKINDQDVPFEAGDSILRAAWRQGMEIPHYCWHPGLSVAANCRMCLVELKSGRPMAMPVLRWDETKQAYVHDTKPKLLPACQTDAAEGMEVSTTSAPVEQTQRAVQEFLLLNHPVDCPICDQAGECKLQDYWLEHQHAPKRKTTEPVHKPKAVRFGPTIVYDAERCVMCTRCIRVCDELVGDHVLDMRERGNKKEVFVAQGRELDHDYTLMTEHVCPVGALTSKDFRFKARVWFLRSAKGVCSGCATGCNTHVDFDPRTDRVFRLRPRDNAEVNKFWMCDDGMMTYQQVHERRVLAATVGRSDERHEVSSEDALAVAADGLRGVEGSKIAVVLSARRSTEDNAVLARLARDVLKTTKLFLATGPGWKGDSILRHTDDSPNRKGAMSVAGGAAVGSLEDLMGEVLEGQVEAVLALGAALDPSSASLAALGKVSTVVTLASNEGALVDVANVVLPVASWAEAAGSYINAKGSEQRFERAIHGPGGVAAAWATLVALSKALGSEMPFETLVDVRGASKVGGAVATQEARA